MSLEENNLVFCLFVRFFCLIWGNAAILQPFQCVTIHQHVQCTVYYIHLPVQFNACVHVRQHMYICMSMNNGT